MVAEGPSWTATIVAAASMLAVAFRALFYGSSVQTCLAIQSNG